MQIHRINNSPTSQHEHCMIKSDGIENGMNSGYHEDIKKAKSSKATCNAQSQTFSHFLVVMMISQAISVIEWKGVM